MTKAKYGNFMAEHDDLDRQISGIGLPKAHELQRAYEDEIEKGESHGPFSSSGIGRRNDQFSDPDEVLGTPGCANAPPSCPMPQ